MALLGTGSVYERWIKCGTDGTEGVSLEEVRAAGEHHEGFISTGGGQLFVGLLIFSGRGAWADMGPPLIRSRLLVTCCLESRVGVRHWCATVWL